MSRMNSGAPIIVKASPNIYTVLAAVATLASLLALIAVAMKANELGWFSNWLSI